MRGALHQGSDRARRSRGFLRVARRSQRRLVIVCLAALSVWLGACVALASSPGSFGRTHVRTAAPAAQPAASPAVVPDVSPATRTHPPRLAGGAPSMKVAH